MEKEFENKIIDVHISTIRGGDVIICRDGLERTVCKGDIKHDSFMGVSIFGDTYKLGHELVRKLIYCEK